MESEEEEINNSQLITTELQEVANSLLFKSIRAALLINIVEHVYLFGGIIRYLPEMKLPPRDAFQVIFSFLESHQEILNLIYDGSINVVGAIPSWWCDSTIRLPRNLFSRDLWTATTVGEIKEWR